MDSGKDFAESGITVRNTFVRHRNVLLSEADFGGLFVDYYLHLKDHDLRPDPSADALFKDLLTAFTLHCAARPRNEVLAWTIRYADPLLSFFFAGDTELDTVVGRVFTEGVREEGGSEMYQEVKRPGKPLHRSYVDFAGQGAIAPVERFYAQSEQRPGRLFLPPDDRGILLTAHPDYDEGWFAQLDDRTVAGLGADEEINLLETRAYRWWCGCSHGKILEVLLPVFQAQADELFAGDESIEVNCPRCAARYRVTREALEAEAEAARRAE
ncbi:MAG: Hsp33 family molecular chaperone HslO [Opitutales bacterium]